MPGIFLKDENPNVFTSDGRALEQDNVESVAPDGRYILQDSMLSIEHLSYVLTLNKIGILYFYKTSTTIKHQKPCIPVIVTNINYHTDELILKYNNDTFSVKVIYFSPEKVEKILNTLSKKDYSKEELSEFDFLNLVHCLIFAPKGKEKEVVERVANIFVTIEKAKQHHRLDLHLALKVMIRYHFKDINDQRRLLIMITMAMSDEELEKVPTYENIVRQIDRLKISNVEKDNVIAEKDITIAEQGNALVEKDKAMDEMQSEINRLREQLDFYKAK